MRERRRRVRIIGIVAPPPVPLLRAERSPRHPCPSRTGRETPQAPAGKTGVVALLPMPVL